MVMIRTKLKLVYRLLLPNAHIVIQVYMFVGGLRCKED